MSKSIDYNEFMRKALQGMVGDVLSQVAENGLPGEHHFYISFLTTAKGVDIPVALHDQFPEEMTIVMQEWFDNLAVLHDRFAVTLSFGGRATDLVVPLHAVTGFADPSVNFNLRFDGAQGDNDDYEEDNFEEEIIDASAEDDGEGAQVISFSKFRKPE